VTSALVLLGDPRPRPANAALDLGEALKATARTLLERLLASRSGSPPPLAIVSLGWTLHSLERVVAYGQDIVEVVFDHVREPRPEGGHSNPMKRPGASLPPVSPPVLAAAGPSTARSSGGPSARSGNPSPQIR
jgi:hypothetical protein